MNNTILLPLLRALSALATCVAISLSAADQVPFYSTTNNGTLPPVHSVRSRASLPGSPVATVVQDSPAPTVTFQGLDDNNATWPPDTMGAVGPNHVMTMLNTQVRVQNRSGTTNYSTVSLRSWWTNVATGVGGFVYDPRLIYDSLSGRWIASATDGSNVLVAVSQSNDPTANWYGYAFATTDGGVDFPTLGLNNDRVVVSWYSYDLNETNHGQGIFVFEKADLMGATNSASVTKDYLFQTNQTSSVTNGMGLVPAISFDTNDTSIFMVQDFHDNPTNKSYLAIYTITGNFGSHVLTRLTNLPSADAWAGSPGASPDIGPQLDTTVKINSFESRMTQAVKRNGSLWCSHMIYLPADNPTHSLIQWWQIWTNGTVLQSGRIGSTNGSVFYGFSSIAVNRFGDALLGYSTFSTNQYASANYALRAYDDPPYSVRSNRLFKAGEAAYYKTYNGKNRWGDYSATVVDPVNDTDFWTIQEYAATNVGSITIDGSGRWGVWWAKVAVAVPANDPFTNSYSISGSSGSTNGTVYRATIQAGEPSHGGVAAGSIWYSWTAPGSGNVSFDSFGSHENLDTLLAVYTGSAVGSLTLITNNDNGQGALASRVTFNASSGITYRIALAAKNVPSESVSASVLNWVQPVAPFFTLHPTNADVLAGTNVTFTSLAIGAPSPAYQWYSNGTSVAGATLTSFSITNVQTNATGSYLVVANNTSGSTTSQVAILTVYNSASATMSLWGYVSNEFRFHVAGVTNSSYVVQASTNLVNWTNIATNVVSFWQTNTSANTYPYRFFRAKYSP